MIDAETRARWMRNVEKDPYGMVRASAVKELLRDISELLAEIERLRPALQGLVSVIDAAGLLNLSNGVQLGPTVWYVKATERMDIARSALESASPTPDE
jgi:hypothetical protein